MNNPTRLQKARYRRSAKGKAADARYKRSAKGRAASARYKQTEKRKGRREALSPVEPWQGCTGESARST